MKTKEHIEQYLKDNLTNDEIIDAWNTYAREHDSDNEVFNNDEDFFNTMFDSMADAVRAVCYGDYHYNQSFVRFNGYANLDTFDNWDDDNSPIDLSVLAEYIMENGDSEFSEIDSDILCQQFCEDFAIKYNINICDVEDCVNKYLEEEDFDFLTEDWEDLEKIIEEKINK